ncbi:hypothetical protein H1R20_g13501, partial [Candolleomyces eurysporus]
MTPLTTAPKLLLDVIIVGAGIGGLTVAHRLATAGHKVTIIEGAQTLGEIGAGMHLSPNVTRLLWRWGFGEKLKEVATVSERVTSRRYDNGEVLTSRPLGDLSEREYGAPSYIIHRADLHRILLSAVQPLVTIKLGSKATDINPNIASVTLASGEIVEGDLVIGADGLRSKVLEVVLPPEEKKLGKLNPKHTGDVAYRALIPSDRLLADPDLREFVREGVNIWIGPERHLVGGELYNLVIVHTARNGDETVKTGDLKLMRTEFESFEPRVRKLLDLVSSATLWPLLDRDPLTSWVHGSGKVCLLGDACHPMLPYRAQGAAMAIEDAAVLGHLLRHITHKSQLPKLLKAYQDLRHPRATDNQLGSRLAQKLNHLADGPEQEARDAAMRSAMEARLKIDEGQSGSENEPGFKIFKDEKERYKLAFGYDADTDVENWIEKNWADTMTLVDGRN